MATTTTDATVLLVEDDLDFRRTLASILDRVDGYTVTGMADTAEKAVVVGVRTQPDIVLLDLQLRGSSGLDTIADLLALSPNTMIVALSGSVDPDDRRRALEAGAFAFVEKCPTLMFPATLGQLLDDLSSRFAQVVAGADMKVPLIRSGPFDRA